MSDVAPNTDVSDDDAPECGWCGKEIAGEPVVDSGQEFWLGRQLAAKYCDETCHSSAAEAWDEQRTHNFYAA